MYILSITFLLGFIFSNCESFDNALNYYTVSKIYAEFLSEAKPGILNDCADNPWYSMVYENNPYAKKRRGDPTNGRSFVRKAAENVWQKYGEEVILMVVLNEDDKNISLFVQASADTNEITTSIFRLDQFLFGCHSKQNEEVETAVYLVRRPSLEVVAQLKQELELVMPKYAFIKDHEVKMLTETKELNCSNSISLKIMKEKFLNDAHKGMDLLTKTVIRLSERNPKSIGTFAYTVKHAETEGYSITLAVEVGAEKDQWSDFKGNKVCCIIPHGLQSLPISSLGFVEA